MKPLPAPKLKSGGYPARFMSLYLLPPLRDVYFFILFLFLYFFLFLFLWLYK